MTRRELGVVSASRLSAPIGFVATQEARGFDLYLLLDLLMIRRGHVARHVRSSQNECNCVITVRRLSVSLSALR